MVNNNKLSALCSKSKIKAALVEQKKKSSKALQKK